MKKNLLILFMIAPILFFAQQNGKNYGNLQNDEASSIVSDDNGFFYIAGSVRDNKDDYEMVRLLKVDNDGKIVFDRYFGGGYRNRALDIIKLKDNNLLICGETWGGFNSPWGRRNVFLLKTNTKGEEIWFNYYFNYHRDQAFSVKELLSGDILVTGYSKSFNEQGTLGDVYLLKTNSTGEKKWEQTFNESGNYSDYI